MKTTNYEISKKLAEAGFKSEHDFSWYKNESGKKLLNYSRCGTVIFQNSKDRILDYYEFCFPAYDLETILEALPSRITNENIFIPRIDYYLRLSKEEIWYENECNCDSDESCPVNQRSSNFFFSKKIFFFEVSRIKDESLADAAAKMWLKLKKENLIKF